MYNYVQKKGELFSILTVNFYELDIYRPSVFMSYIYKSLNLYLKSFHIVLLANGL